MLQRRTALHWAAEKAYVAVTLLLNGVKAGVRNAVVTCTLSIDNAYIACDISILIDTFSCSDCHVHVSCLMWENTAVHTSVASMLAILCSLWQKHYGNLHLCACCREILRCIWLQKQVMWLLSRPFCSKVLALEPEMFL